MSQTISTDPDGLIQGTRTFEGEGVLDTKETCNSQSQNCFLSFIHSINFLRLTL